MRAVRITLSRRSFGLAGVIHGWSSAVLASVPLAMLWGAMVIRVGAEVAGHPQLLELVVLQMCYACSMSMVASRELRNDTAAVLRRVQAGEEVTITVNGQPVAVIAAVRPKRRRWLTKEELVNRLETSQADAGLRADLVELAGETTDDLDKL